MAPAGADEGRDLLISGLAATERGEYPSALVTLSKALRSFRAEKDAPREADALVALGRVHRALGRHADAKRHFEEALGIDRRLGRPSHVGASLVELGTEDWLLGDFPAAELRQEAAFKAYQKAEDVHGAAAALVDLGIAQSSGGDPVNAKASFEAAVVLYETGRDWVGLGDARTGLGSALAKQGNYAGAIRAHRAAIDAYALANADPDADEGRGAALHNLANVYASLGDFERALGLYSQARGLLGAAAWRVDAAMAGLHLAGGRVAEAISLLESALDRTDPGGRAGLSLNLAIALREAGRAGEAEPHLDVAATSSDRTIRSAAELARGDALLEAGDAKAAAKRFGIALDGSRSAGDIRWRALHGRARALRAQGADALPDLRAAVARIEDGRRSLEDLDVWAARRWVAARADVYRDLIDALLSSGDGASALLYSERLRVAELRPGGAAGDPREQQLDALDARRQLLQDALESSDRDPERAAALEVQLVSAREDFSRAVDELRTRHSDFDRLVRVDPTDIEAYQRDLGDDEVVLQPIVLPDRIALLVFSAGPLVVRNIPIPEAELSATLGRVLTTLRTRRLKRPEKLEARLDQLGEWLIAPVADEIAGKQTVVVAASGILRYLPFQMLRHKGRYLVQDYDVVNVTNVGSLKRRDDEALRLASQSLLALGNPDGTLPAADAEIDAIGSLFPGGLILHGKDASLAALRGSSGRRVVHLATHGVLDAAAPEASYIVLAGEGGRLAYTAIPGLYSALQDVGMVVLSACESAVPVTPEGGMGGGGLEISGLANQFRRAGVPRLVASLWQVGDESTKELMVGFYRGLSEGRRPPEALAAAQRSLLASDATAHPFHWAPFILVGTPR
jgi:CHAT domain-containing protein